MNIHLRLETPSDYHAVEAMTREALEFDKKFPPKERHTTLPISLLLNCLKPKAAAAIQELKLPSLNFLHSKSEREISLLSGVDETAIETIRALTRENRIRWGKG